MLQRQKNFSWHLIGFPDGSNDIVEKSTVILYTYIDRHAGTPNQIKDQTYDEPGLQLNLLQFGSRIEWVSALL